MGTLRAFLPRSLAPTSHGRGQNVGKVGVLKPLGLEYWHSMPNFRVKECYQHPGLVASTRWSLRRLKVVGACWQVGTCCLSLKLQSAFFGGTFKKLSSLASQRVLDAVGASSITTITASYPSILRKSHPSSNTQHDMGIWILVCVFLVYIYIYTFTHITSTGTCGYKPTPWPWKNWAVGEATQERPAAGAVNVDARSAGNLSTLEIGDPVSESFKQGGSRAPEPGSPRSPGRPGVLPGAGGARFEVRGPTDHKNTRILPKAVPLGAKKMGIPETMVCRILICFCAMYYIQYAVSPIPCTIYHVPYTIYNIPYTDSLGSFCLDY